MRIEEEIKLDFKDVLIRPKRSTLRSRSEVDIARTYVFKYSRREWKGVPIMIANMDSTGTFEMCAVVSARGVVTCLHKYYSSAQILDFCAKNKQTIPYIAISAGTGQDDFSTISAVFEAQSVLPVEEQINFICLDVANGYSEGFVETVRRYRASFPKATLIAGNVVTGEMTEELILSGADIVKIGIGPGSVCTTRIQTGVGYPQLSAVIECSDAAHGLGGMVVSDGGCTCPGDFAKAFGGGADFVMSGGMFSGHDESGGELIQRANGLFKVFYGMSSTTAMDKHSGGVAEYRSSEGKTVEVPYRGPVAATLQDILGGLRSACTYVGASSIKEMSKRTTFVRCTQQVNPVFNSNNVQNKLPTSVVQAAIDSLSSSSSSSSKVEEPASKKGRTN